MDRPAIAAVVVVVLWISYGVFEFLKPWGEGIGPYRPDLGYELVADPLLYVVYGLTGGVALALTVVALLGFSTQGRGIARIERAPAFASCATVAGAHHERLDGSGYPRGSRSADLAIGARILAVADVVQALGEARPYRPAYPADRAASILRQEARAGRLGGEVVETVLAVASGGRPTRVRATGALSERELEVVRLLAGGHANKEISRRLAISENTVRHHLESVYAKLDARTRTGAVMQALGRGLL